MLAGAPPTVGAAHACPPTPSRLAHPSQASSPFVIACGGAAVVVDFDVVVVVVVVVDLDGDGDVDWDDVL